MTRGRLLLWAIGGALAALSLWQGLRAIGVGRELAPLDLGALTLTLPDGARIEGSYAYGKVVTPMGLGTATIVLWRPGDLLEPSLFARAEVAGGQARGAADAKASEVARDLGDLPYAALSVRGDGYAAEATAIACGGLRFTVRTTGSEADVARVHAEVLAAARCHPDPAHTGDVAGAPVVVPLPPGWVARAPKQAHALFTGDGVTMSVASLEIANPDHFADQMTSAMKGQGMTIAYGERETVESADGPRYLWPTTIAVGSRTEGLTELWRCGEDGPWVMVQLLPAGGKAWPGARDLLLATRCRAAGEPAPTYPQAPEAGAPSQP